jgi:uncharacterized membrane protein YkoI
MKTTFLTIALAGGTLLGGCSQRITAATIPSLVQNAVQVKFPEAKTIEWEKKGTNYEAEFEIAGLEHTVLLDSTGHLLMQKQDINAAQLPEAVTTAFQRDFQGFQVDDLEQVTQQGQVYYQVELEKSLRSVKKVYAAQGAEANISYWD